jgi:hypothetical protein
MTPTSGSATEVITAATVDLRHHATVVLPPAATVALAELLEWIAVTHDPGADHQPPGWFDTVRVADRLGVEVPRPTVDRALAVAVALRQGTP